MYRWIRIIMPFLLASALSCSDLGESVSPNPECQLSETTVNFGAVALGDSVDRTIRIANVGSADLTCEVVQLTRPFHVVTGRGMHRISPGEEHEVVVRFAPADTGASAATLELGSPCASVAVVGWGDVPAEGSVCTVEPPALDFGAVQQGESADRMVWVINDGLIEFDVALPGPCGDFQVLNGSGVTRLDEGDSLAVVIRFAPAAVGVQECTIATGVNCNDIVCRGTGAPANTVFFGADIQPIFNASCTPRICHGGAVTAGLDLRAGASYNDLVNVVTTNYAPNLRIVPGSPDQSVLYHKVMGDMIFGGRMPPSGTALSAQQVELIRAWIAEGALNN